MAPVDVNGITKYATEQLHLLYHDVYGLAASAVRLTNVFGPRQRLRDDLQGFLPIFLRRALADDAITVFGDGAQERDCLYVDDVVECLLLTAAVARRRRARSSTSATTSDCRWARSPTPSSPPRAPVGSSTCPGRRTATPSTSGRTSATRRRRSGCWAGSRARRSPPASSARSRSTPSGDPGTCDRRRVTRHTPRSRRRPRAAARSRWSPSSRDAVARVVRSGSYLFGPELDAFEAEFAAFTGRRHAVGVASGTDALRLSLVALGIGPGDEVLVPAFTAVPTAAAVCAAGATPVFVDVDPDTATLDPGRAAAAVTERTRAVDPGAPLRAAGGASRPRAARGRGCRAGARRARPATRAPRPRRTASTRPRTWVGSPTGARSSPTTTTLAATVRLLRAHGVTRRLRAHAGVDERAAVRRRGRGAARRPAAARGRQRAPAGDRGAVPRGGAGRCAGRPTTSATSTTCAWPGSPTATAFRARVPFDTGVHYPRALTQQPAYRAIRRERRARKRKRGPPSAYRSRASPR